MHCKITFPSYTQRSFWNIACNSSAYRPLNCQRLPDRCGALDFPGLLLCCVRGNLTAKISKIDREKNVRNSSILHCKIQIACNVYYVILFTQLLLSPYLWTQLTSNLEEGKNIQVCWHIMPPLKLQTIIRQCWFIWNVNMHNCKKHMYSQKADSPEHKATMILYYANHLIPISARLVLSPVTTHTDSRQ